MFQIENNTLIKYTGTDTAVTVPEGIREIGWGAFQGCRSLKQVTLPDSLQSIRGNAFGGCTALEEIHLPAGVTEIHRDTFFGCTALKRVSIPGVMQIHGFAFRDCTGLTEFSGVPEGIAIDDDAFRGCRSLADKQGLVRVGHILFAYTGRGGHVTVPEGITVLRENVFRERYHFSSHYEQRFRSSGSLTGITLPEGLGRIPDGAFMGCKNLRQIRIPESVEAIGDNAFYGTGLTDVTIPEKVSRIGEDAFRECRQLEKIFLAEGNQNYAVIRGALVDKVHSRLLCLPPRQGDAEFTVPDCVSAIADHAFGSNMTLQKLVIPETVKRIGDELFQFDWNTGSGSLTQIEMALGAGSEGVGEKAFPLREQNGIFFYPRLPLTAVHSSKEKCRLALGYCLHPESYDPEYAEHYRKFLRSRKKTVLAEAGKWAAPNILQALNAFYEAEDTQPKKPRAKKLSPQEKVLLLEEAVRKGDVEEAATVIAAHKPFEFLARALAFACYAGNPEMVKLLVENGASFHYERTAANSKKYQINYATSRTNNYANFDLLLAKTGSDDRFFWHSHFGGLSRELLPAADCSRRGEVAAYLLEQKVEGFRPVSVLYYAVLWNCPEVAHGLLEKGVGLSHFWLEVLTTTAPSSERSEFLSVLASLTPKDCLWELNRFADLTENKLLLSPKFYEECQNLYTRCDVLQCILERTNIQKLPKRKVLEAVIDAEAADSLALLVEKDWITTPALRDQLIEYAQTRQKVQTLAWLMNYKNATADPAAEEAKREAKAARELMADPGSAAALKKIWGTKKLADGTFVLTNYKGQDTEVEVPARIGKTTVSAIGSGCFAPSSSERWIVNNEVREKITAIHLPSTVTTLEGWAFSGCRSLHTVTGLEGVTSVGKRTFYGCKAMGTDKGFLIRGGILFGYYSRENAITIPEGVRIIAPYAFDRDGDCYAAPKTLDIPDSVEIIGEGAFRNQKNLTKVTFGSGLRRLEASAFERCGKLSRVTLPDGLEYMGENLLMGTAITSLVIPDTVRFIGDYALDPACNLQDLYISGSAMEFDGEPIGCYGEKVRVHTPQGSPADVFFKTQRKAILIYDWQPLKTLF